jgi:protein TonB
LSFRERSSVSPRTGLLPVAFSTLRTALVFSSRFTTDINYGMKRSMFRRMLIAAILFSVAVTGNSETPNATHVKHDAIYAPRPNYPLYARQYHQTGEGLFVCHIRPDGTVASVDVLRSTSHEMLDRAAIKALRQWRFRAGDWSTVNVPINFHMSGKGSPIRHRMSGAVIPD